MTDHVYDVLFLCTGASARSILAESILRKQGAGRFVALPLKSFDTLSLKAKLGEIGRLDGATDAAAGAKT